ncbi:LPXTG cell wall anchor domain-containing protein [Herbiconiux sp. L3-i23]|uniref:LPXTG cell wall anchor domain-containing protein n=1 Tax=Herbiconiux sp. L3-i23 TaxID=2905871 RepID=UPI00204AECC2|nr:LPXTG cell wall anchor domain-containing protein [Herbiconiux sp. L3-i23]BDI22933.1 hypothetical protein L3i23_17090 [Herbiconiux sp. L3-i23]
MISPVRKSFTRASAVVLGCTVAFGGALVAGPAVAAPLDVFTISGVAGFAWEDGSTDSLRASDDILVTLWDADAEEVVDEVYTSSQTGGGYAFTGVEAGLDYELEFESEDADYPADDEFVDVLELSSDVTVPNQALYPYYLDGGAITVTGEQVFGQTVTAAVAPFTGTTSVVPEVTYEWGYSGGNYGSAIDGANTTSLLVPAETVGSHLAFTATARADGYAKTQTSWYSTIEVTAPQLPAAPAPVADSSLVDQFLASKSVVKKDAASAGLPAAGLSTESSYTATIDWFAGDSFVDVYAYSAPRLVGTFPVVNDVVQVTLTPEMLSLIGSGTHTLVFVGQTSGAVDAVAFEILPALASTGADLGLPLAGGAALLLLGGALVAVRRRKAAHA